MSRNMEEVLKFATEIEDSLWGIKQSVYDFMDEDTRERQRLIEDAIEEKMFMLNILLSKVRKI